MTGILGDLRALPVWLAVLVATVAAVVLVLRLAGLAVVLVGLLFVAIVDLAERCEAAVCGGVGIPPIAGSFFLLVDERSTR